MLRRRFASLVLAGALLATLAIGGVKLAGGAGEECFRVYLLNGVETSREAVDPALCGVVEPTHTPHPSPSPSHAAGWHEPTAHEHGDAPPQFVLDSGLQPFTQSRESHAGYKGHYARDNGGKGVESYLVTHIVSTTGARSHGDHDFQFWLRLPTGEVLAYEGVLDFGTPPPLRTRDTGERPIILSVGDGGCETWYSRPGATLFDFGGTICRRYQSFDGTILGGDGTFRTTDWVIPCSRFPAGHAARNYCTTEFGVARMSFIRNSVDYSAPSVVPVN